MVDRAAISRWCLFWIIMGVWLVMYKNYTELSDRIEALEKNAPIQMEMKEKVEEQHRHKLFGGGNNGT